MTTIDAPEPNDPMNSGHAREALPVLVACPICQEPIRSGAKKCVHCDSMLDWRRWIGVSQTTLALLVALVSVVAASAPHIAELFRHDFSEVRLNIRQVFGQRLEVTASNRGNKAALFLSAHLVAATRDRRLEPIQLEIAGGPLIGAGQDTLYGLSVPPALIPTFLALPHKDIKSVTAILRVSEFRRDAEERTIDVPLDQFRLLCRATEDLDIISRRNANAPLEDRRLMSPCS